MHTHRSTTRAAQIVGIPTSHLYSLLRAGRLAPPMRDDSGDYLWSERDIEAARQALRMPRRQRARQQPVA
jgi:DNA-binding transcriptional MerR regulator